MSSKQPLISFVIVSRNDNYAPSMEKRQKTAFKVLFEQLEKHSIVSEIILVDWNPPIDRPPLKNIFSIQPNSKNVAVRYIEVPPNIHYKYKYSRDIPIHVAAGWNTGIRRARGEFILPKSADTFYSNDVMKFLTRGHLDAQHVYRCDRVDISENAFIQSIQNPSNFMSVENLPPLHRYKRPTSSPHPQVPNLHTDACGDFILMHRDVWPQIGGFWEGDSVISAEIDGLALNAAVALGIEEKQLSDSCVVLKPSHSKLFSKRLRYTFRPGWILIHAWLLLKGASMEDHLLSRIRYDYPKRKFRASGISVSSYAKNYIAKIIAWHTKETSPCLNAEDWGCANTDLNDQVLCKPEK